MSDAWRVSVINREFLLCSSYPPLFYVPAEIQVGLLNQVADVTLDCEQSLSFPKALAKLGNIVSCYVFWDG